MYCLSCPMSVALVNKLKNSLLSQFLIGRLGAESAAEVGADYQRLRGSTECSNIKHQNQNHILTFFFGHNMKIWPTDAAARRSIVQSTKAFLFDCDGVIWRGNHLVEGGGLSGSQLCTCDQSNPSTLLAENKKEPVALPWPCPVDPEPGGEASQGALDCPSSASGLPCGLFSPVAYFPLWLDPCSSFQL